MKEKSMIGRVAVVKGPYCDSLKDCIGKSVEIVETAEQLQDNHFMCQLEDRSRRAKSNPAWVVPKIRLDFSVQKSESGL